MGGFEYRQIKGLDEMVPVFGNFSRSLVKRGADKIYWRTKDAEERRFGSWSDGVWLDCETGGVRFGDRCVKESWGDYFDRSSPSRWDNPFSKDFSLYSYRSGREYRPNEIGYGRFSHSWYLGSLAEWRGPDDEIEPRLAARLAEAAEFNFGLGFDGPETENPFVEAANEVARFYETRARLARLSEEADARGEKYWDGDFPETSPEELEELRRIKSKWDLEDVEPERWEVPICWELADESSIWKRDASAATPKVLFAAPNDALVPYCATRSREIERRLKAALREIPKSEIKARQDVEERFKKMERDLNYGFNLMNFGFLDLRSGKTPLLGELDELVDEARRGTSSEWLEPDGEEAPATRADALSNDWRERLASLLDYRLDRRNALYDAAKGLYVEIIGTKVREMKGCEVWCAPGGFGVEICYAGGKPKNPAWLKIGTLFEFYKEKRGLYWGSDVKKEDKIGGKDRARHWLAGEIGRRLEAALKAEN